MADTAAPDPVSAYLAEVRRHRDTAVSAAKATLADADRDEVLSALADVSRLLKAAEAALAPHQPGRNVIRGAVAGACARTCRLKARCHPRPGSHYQVTCPACARIAELEQREAEHEDLLASVWLYVKWRYVTRQLTTEERKLFADSVDRSHVRTHDGICEAPSKTERWWRPDEPPEGINDDD